MTKRSRFFRPCESNTIQQRKEGKGISINQWIDSYGQTDSLLIFAIHILPKGATAFITLEVTMSTRNLLRLARLKAFHHGAPFFVLPRASIARIRRCRPSGSWEGFVVHPDGRHQAVTA